jgi:Alternative complex III, ActD subunit
MKAIYGLYPDPGSAERAMNQLRSSCTALGFEVRDICLAASEPFDEYDLGWREQKTRMPWLAALGGLIGGTSGYLLVALTQRAYPLPTGNMPIVALWPTGVVAYEMTMLGAILTTLITLLISARIPDWRGGKLYDPAVSNGKILIGVTNPPDKARDELVKRLRAAGAEVVKEFGK